MTAGALLLDGVVLAVLIFFAVWGSKKGLIRAVFGLFTGVLGLLLTWKLYPYMAQFLTTLGLRATIQSSLAERLSIASATTISAQTDVINSLNLPEILRNWLIQNNNYEAYGALGATSFGEYITGFLADLSVNSVSVLLTLLVSLVLVRVLSALMGLMNKLPVIGQINRLLGMAVGVAIGLLVVWGLLLLFTVLGLGTSLTSILDAIENSKLASFLYNHNLLMQFALKVFQ